MRAMAPAGLLIALLLPAAGCRQKMAEQPSYKPLETCDFFADGRSERPLVAGTVARGHLLLDTALRTGRRTREGEPLGQAASAKTSGVSQQNQEATPTPAAGPPTEADYSDYVDTFPLPVTREMLEHGYNRYMIYCVLCHDPLGTGQGKIVERGYTAPPSYHIERLRKVPVGHLFAVASEGYGSMPSYSAQIPLEDRWAIVAYIRALQRSQHFPEGGSSP